MTALREMRGISGDDNWTGELIQLDDSLSAHHEILSFDFNPSNCLMKAYDGLFFFAFGIKLGKIFRI